jgi:hypothetical protein
VLSGVFGGTYCHYLQGLRISNLLGVLFNSENGGRALLRNPCELLLDYTVSPLCEDVPVTPPEVISGGSGSISGADMWGMRCTVVLVRVSSECPLSGLLPTFIIIWILPASSNDQPRRGYEAEILARAVFPKLGDCGPLHGHSAQAQTAQLT